MNIKTNKLINLIKECITECIQEINEGVNNQNYSHFAVNKNTKKIVNGWNYSNIDASELRQFAKDYFITDLIDYGFNPKEYTIWTKKSCLKNDIDPDDDSNWSNS